MTNIGRRSFFKSIGLPALFLPFINLFPSRLKKPKTTPLFNENFPSIAPAFGYVAAKCSKCGLTLKIPYLEGSETYHFVGTYPCSRCGEKIKFDVLIKAMVKIGCHYHP